MNKKKALEIVGDKARWELRKMKKALEIMEILNTPEENERLKAIKVLLKN